MEGMIPDKRPIVSLVQQACAGTLCLPNFQRDFIWKREEVADLVRSIMRGYFIGSLLLLRCDADNPPFAPVFVRGAKPKHREPRPDLLILDGQQRLTALLYALTAPNLSLKDSSQRRWFFVDLDLLLRDPDSDAVVVDLTERELDGLDGPDVQYQKRMLPCTVLLKSRDFMKWRDGLDDYLRKKDPKAHDLFREEWRDPWTKAAADFQNFDVSLVELPRVSDSDQEAIGRVCAVFEKLNSSGVDLSIYDLLTARLYRSGIRLHDLWTESCKRHKRLAQWSKGKPDTNKLGVLILRTEALLRGLDPKPRILIDLSPKDFEKDWQRAASAVERALELLTLVDDDGFGVFDAKWLPGLGMLAPLAALRTEIEERKLGNSARSDLRRWYWCSVFLERYSSGVESKSRKDYAEMLAHWTKEEPQPAVFSEAAARISADGFTVADSASHASAVYCGVFCMLALRKARDWRLKESIRLQELDDHHIFPRRYLKEHGVHRRVVRNSILNRTLISDDTNRKIRDSAPAEYIKDKTVFPSGPSQRLMDPHFLTEAAVGFMGKATEKLSESEVNDLYGKFRKEREAAIVKEIRQLCFTP
jgi:hypothetical protein